MQGHRKTTYTSWREEIMEVLEKTGDKASHLITTLSEEDLDKPLNDTYSLYSEDITPFVAWSDRYVYFSHNYDGMASIEYVPRHPNSETPERHIGN